MSYTLCITEKPSVGRDIAAILGANSRHDGYFEGNGYCVTWTFGHLCCLKEPADYTDSWKRWSLGSLPMIPPKFGIKLIHDKGIEKQFKVIKTLASNASRIINCGDAGQEGELIQRWVMQKARVKCPVERLWISSLTDQSIREGFADLKPAANYDNLYFAGLSRAIGDWLLGMNSTRLYTLRYSQPGAVLSVGRVQTPTLALIVDRCREIAAFVPKDYYELRTRYRDVIFSNAKLKFDDPQKARELLDSVSRHPLVITNITEKKGKESPDRLFDLTSLQVECNKRFGWTAENTLKLIQSLYEKKVTTYPRVDTTYLSDDLYAKVPGILERMTPYTAIIRPIFSDGKKLPKSKKVFDSSKVTDHHAIIPTGESPAILVGDERHLYHLIARRFIAAFYPDCVFNTTTVEALAGDTPFKATGKVIVDPGWRVIYQNDLKQQETDTDNEKKEDDEDEAQGILPPFTQGESGPHDPFLQKKTTQPPKPYTEATLLRAMETAGRTVDDPDLRQAMKENGIGRPSTRAAIIETLFKRHYIERKRRSIFSTPAGEALIDTISQPLLKSAKLTGLWENKLRRIERGDYAPAQFIDELKTMLTEIVTGVLADNTPRRIEVPMAPPPSKTSRTKAKKTK